MKCFQCGTCTASCVMGPYTTFRTRRLLRRALLGLKNQVLYSDDLWLCAACYTCYDRCPRGVKIPVVISALRALAVDEGVRHPGVRHAKAFLRSVGRDGRLNEAAVMLSTIGLNPKGLIDLLKMARGMAEKGKRPPTKPEPIPDVEQVQKIYELVVKR